MNSFGREACGHLWGLGEDAQALVCSGPDRQEKGKGAQEMPWRG